MTQRHRSIVDVSLILRREGQVLMLRRAGSTFATGMLCFPSGHLERGETVIAAVIREAREEIGVHIAPNDVRLLHVVHHIDPGRPEADDRIGFFFEADKVTGEPVNAEPHKCSELVWVDPYNLPADVVPYQAAGLNGTLSGGVFGLHGWPTARP